MKNEILESFGNSWNSVENDGRGYYRLNVNPELISFNIDVLREHENFEISELFSK